MNNFLLWFKSHLILKLIIIFISAVLIISLIVVLYSKSENNKSNKSGQSNLITTTASSKDAIATTVVNQPVDLYQGWKDYYYEPWDITIRYPSTYEVISQPEANISCDESKAFLKSSYKCISDVSYPSITIHKLGSAENDNYVNFFGPAQIGGQCAEGSKDVNANVVIKNKTYIYNLKVEPDGEYCSRASTLADIAATGNKSIWAKFRAVVSARNKQIFDESLNIISTIY